MGGNFARESYRFTRHTVSGAARFAFFIIWFKNSILSPSGDAHPRGPACDERHLRARQECHHTHLALAAVSCDSPVDARRCKRMEGLAARRWMHPEQPPVRRPSQDEGLQAHRPQVEQC